MRINNSKHVPWFIFVVLATAAACWLYAGNFHPSRLPAGMQLPDSLRQTPSDHRSIGGTPLGLWFGSISLAIFIFAALLSLRKKIPLWRVGTVQRWLRAHIWLTFLTIPLVILHSGFRLGGAMTMLLMALYAIVMMSGIYGLILQHHLPRLMKERLPAETVFEQIPHIRAQLVMAAEKMRDSFKPGPPKKPDAGAPAATAAKTATATSAAMASTAGEMSTPAARAKTASGSPGTAAPVTEGATPKAAVVAAAVSAAGGEVSSKSAAGDGGSYNTPKVVRPTRTAAEYAANAAGSAAKSAETIGTPTARVQSDPPGAAVSRAAVPAGDEAAPNPASAPPAPAIPTPQAAATEVMTSSTAGQNLPPVTAAATTAGGTAAAGASIAPKSPAPAAARPAAPAAPKPAAAPKAPPHVADPASEAALIDFIERQILPYLGAKRGEKFRLNNARFSDDTFRFVKLRVAEAYRSRVAEIQGWVDERRMLDLQTRLQHWLHGWLFLHVPISFLLLMLTLWHAYVTLFYY